MTEQIVNICGIPHTIIECEDSFNIDLHFGQIDYAKAQIKINKDIPTELKKEALCHEIIHGILVHLGYQEESQDEKFVQQLGNAISQTFNIRTRGNITDDIIEKIISKGE